MDINMFHEITKDDRDKKERILELKVKMLSFFNEPTLERGIDVLHLCVSLTNDYLYCSKPINLQYSMPIEPDQYHIDSFIYDWNNFYYNELMDERSYRYYCRVFFELTTRILYFKKFNEQDIEKAYVNKSYGNAQLTLF